MSDSAVSGLPLRTSAHPADPAPELQVARDMARRGLPLATGAVLVAGATWGAAGAASAGFAVGLVLLNFLVSAWLLATTARISYALLMGTALFGYLLRLALIGAAVFAVKDASWVEPMALGLTLVVTHLGLLVWELRYVSASLAYPGLKPATKEIASR
jgi:hypothetical protein